MSIKSLTKLTVIGFFALFFGISTAHAQTVFFQAGAPCAYEQGNPGNVFGTWDGGTQTCTLNRDVIAPAFSSASRIFDPMTIDCDGHTVRNTGIFSQFVDNVTVENCEMDNANMDIEFGNFVTLRNNHFFNLGPAAAVFTGCVFCGDSFPSLAFVTVEDNLIEKTASFSYPTDPETGQFLTGVAISVEKIVVSQINNNTIISPANSRTDALHVLRTTATTFNGNHITNGGIQIVRSQFNQVTNNTVSGGGQLNQGAGLYMLGDPATPVAVHTISGNTFTGMKSYSLNHQDVSSGIYLDGYTPANTIMDNIITDNDIGLRTAFVNDQIFSFPLQFVNNLVQGNLDDINIGPRDKFACNSTFSFAGPLTGGLSFAFINTDNTVLDGGSTKYADIVVCGADGVKLNDVKAEAIAVMDSSNAEITNSNIKGTWAAETLINQGVSANSTNGLLIDNNKISATHSVGIDNAALDLKGGTNSDVVISNNTVTGNDETDGMQVNSLNVSNPALLSSNTSSNNRNGYVLRGVDATGNTANKNAESGFFINGETLTTGNTANQNGEYGYVYRGGGNEASNNTANNNGILPVWLDTLGLSCNNDFDFDSFNADGQPLPFYANSAVVQNGGTFSQAILCNADNAELSNAVVLGRVDSVSSDGVLIDGVETTQIKLDDSNFPTVQNSIVSATQVDFNRYGIYLLFSGGGSVTNNEVSDIASIPSSFFDIPAGIRLDTSGGTTISDNNVHDIDGYGIWLTSGGGENITGNDVQFNTNYGVYRQFAGGGSVINNNLSNNSIGFFSNATGGYPVNGNVMSNNVGGTGFLADFGSGGFQINDNEMCNPSFPDPNPDLLLAFFGAAIPPPPPLSGNNTCDIALNYLAPGLGGCEHPCP